jgi:transposase-like protein
VPKLIGKDIPYKIRDLYKAGKTYREIRDILQVSRQTIARYVRDHQKRPRGRKPNEELDQKIKELYREGLSYRDISAVLPVGKSRISRCVLRDLEEHELRINNRKNNGLKKSPKPRPFENNFPVHPEVLKAKESLIEVFMISTPGSLEYADAYISLEALLYKHHPIESRPPEQMTLENREARNKPKKKAPEIKHGTYSYSSSRCTCNPCKEARRQYNQEYKARKKKLEEDLTV